MDNKTSESDDTINVLVKDQHDNKLYFKIKKDLPVKMVLLEFCKRTELDYQAVTFLLNGSRFRPHLTATELNIESGDEFEALSPMLGGAFC